MKNLNYISLLLVLFFWSSCSDDFVDTTPIASETDGTFYSNMAGINAAVTACYSTFCTIKTFDLCITMTMGSIASDEAEAGSGGRTVVVEFQNVDLLTHTPAESNVLEWPYSFVYRGINYCNIALEKIPALTEGDDPEHYDAALLQQRLGEVYFLRAYYYFTLTQIFGGVPLVDHVLSGSEYTLGRSEISEVYDLIKSDLRKAINRLPTREDWGPSNIGRASKGAAQALLAKVFLYESSYAKYCGDDGEYNGLDVSRFQNMEQQWDSVVYWAEQVIGSGQYSLVGLNGERFHTWRDPSEEPNTGGYQLIFMVDGDNSPESVFEIQNAYDAALWFYTRGEALTYWCAPTTINIPSGGTVSLGWGWWCPSDFLVSQYEEGDPRYDATILEEGDTFLTTFGWITPNYTTLIEETGLHRYTRKFEASVDEFWGHTPSWQEGPVNIKLIRYADVVLFAAEAYLELNNQAKATEYINMVRKRARMSGPEGDAGIPADLASVTHDDLVHERLIELAMEGHRFFDLIRWNLAGVYLTNHVCADGSVVNFEEGKHEFFPIPDEEVIQSGGLVEQYPKWQ